LLPAHLLVIRSGATEYDLLGRSRGTLDIPLSNVGIAEAEAAAKHLAAVPPDVLFMADCPCAEETATIIGRQVGLRPRSLATLDNLDQGLWQGMLVEEIRRRQPRVARQWEENPWAVMPPEGEPLDEACNRVDAVLERILKRHPESRVALVVPHPLDRIIRWTVAGEPLGDLWDRDAAVPAVVDLPVAAGWKPFMRHQPLLG
jgi:broad specificity phosphatase PhoE